MKYYVCTDTPLQFVQCVFQTDLSLLYLCTYMYNISKYHYPHLTSSFLWNRFGGKVESRSRVKGTLYSSYFSKMILCLRYWFYFTKNKSCRSLSSICVNMSNMSCRALRIWEQTNRHTCQGNSFKGFNLSVLLYNSHSERRTERQQAYCTRAS